MKSREEMRSDAVNIFEEAVRAVDPLRAVRRAVSVRGDRLDIHGRSYDLTRYEHIVVVGAGKAGAKMAGAMEEILGRRLGPSQFGAARRANLEVWVSRAIFTRCTRYEHKFWKR